MSWQSVIGLEVHIQLNTKSKIFSSAPTVFGSKPNMQASDIDLAMPGTMPFLNQEVVNMAIKFGLATEATINKRSVFARKNYFYPDLPKGYQISQNNYPIITGGHITIDMDENHTKIINLTRAHLEEDAGKLVHNIDSNISEVDLNRAGIPLLEIVSEPELRSAEEAVKFLKRIHNIVQYLDICDGNMQEGSLRCDANVSVRLSEDHPFGTRVEIKNINSFKFVEQAINYEIERQIDCIKHSEEIIQETRLYDSDRKVTKSMRNKENAHDYRYFAEPELPPLIISQEQIDSIRKIMPELSMVKKDRFVHEFNLNEYDAKILTANKDIAHYFEECLSDSNLNPKTVANWILGEVMAYLNKSNLDIKNIPFTSKHLIELLNKIEDKTISGKIAKVIFEEICLNGGEINNIIAKKGLTQISDPKEIDKLIEKTFDDNQSQLTSYLEGKDRLYGFFVGQIMKNSGGKVNPELLNKILKEKLEKLKV